MKRLGLLLVLLVVSCNETKEIIVSGGPSQPGSSGNGGSGAAGDKNGIAPNASAPAIDAKETGGGTVYSLKLFTRGRELLADIKNGVCGGVNVDPVELEKQIDLVAHKSNSAAHVYDRNGKERQAVNGHYKGEYWILISETHMDAGLGNDPIALGVLFMHEMAPYLNKKDSAGEFSSQFFKCIPTAKKVAANDGFHQSEKVAGPNASSITSSARYEINVNLKSDLKCADFSDETRSEIQWPKQSETGKAVIWAHLAKNTYPHFIRGPYLFKSSSDENVHMQCQEIHQFDDANVALYVHTAERISTVEPQGEEAYVEGEFEMCFTLRFSNSPLPANIPAPKFSNYQNYISKVEHDSVRDEYIQWVYCAVNKGTLADGWDFNKNTADGIYSVYEYYEKELELSKKLFADRFKVGDLVPVVANMGTDIPVSLSISEILPTGEARVAWPVTPSHRRREYYPLSQLGFPVKNLGDFSVGDVVINPKYENREYAVIETQEGSIAKIWSNGIAEVKWYTHNQTVLFLLKDLQLRQKP